MSSVIIVEDNKFVKKLYVNLVQKMGFSSVHSFATGEEAVEFAAKNPNIELILMDIELEGGGINGIETASEIRDFCSAPILFISGCEWKNVSSQIEEIHTSVFTPKVFDQKTLESIISTSFSIVMPGLVQTYA